MSSDELKLIIHTLAYVGTGAVIAAVVGALLLRSYFPSYLTEKGKNLATREDIQTLVDQVRRIESAKADVTQTTWLRQQQWSNREKHYLGLLLDLTKFRITLLDRLNYYTEPGSEHNQEIGKSDYFKLLQKNGSKAILSIREQTGPASVFLSVAALDVLKELISNHWHLVEFSDCQSDYLSRALKLADKASDLVLAEARKSLANAEAIS